jgi:hypothetical protein
MSMFSSLSKLVQTTFNTATDSVATVGKGLDIANHYVEENHKRITKTTTTAAQLSVARFNQDVADELEASEKLKAQYDAVVADW